MGVLSCEGGGYYHEWSLNPNYHEAGSFLCPKGHSLLEFQTPTAGYSCDGGEGCPGQDSRYPVGTPLFGCRICNFDFCSQCVVTAKTEPKYISTAPDVEGEDTYPGVPLSNGVCLHCGQSKEQHQAKGGISSVNLLKNDIPMEQAKALASILKEHPTLKSVCGNSGEETELDMSGKEIGEVGAMMLAPEIAGNRALTSLNLSSNNIGEVGQEQCLFDVEMLLQSFGTGIEALQEHFEQPEDNSSTAVISMVSTQRFEHLLSPIPLPITTRCLQTDCCCP
jgi:hypothetical protein